MDPDSRTKVLHRLKSAEGHVAGVIRMVEADQPCMAIMRQIQAVQGALKEAQSLLFTHHLEYCLDGFEFAEGEVKQQQLVDELLTLVAHRLKE